MGEQAARRLARQWRDTMTVCEPLGLGRGGGRLRRCRLGFESSRKAAVCGGGRVLLYGDFEDGEEERAADEENVGAVLIRMFLSPG